VDRRAFLYQLAACITIQAASGYAQPERAESPLIGQLVSAYNTGSADEIGKMVRAICSPDLLSRFNGAAGLVAALLEDYAAYGPLESIRATGGPPGVPVAWHRGTITKAYLGLGGRGTRQLEGLTRVEGVRPVFPRSPGSWETLAADVHRYLTESAAAGHFSGVVRIERRGELLYQGAFGAADSDTSEPNTVDTAFNVASCGKMFTAVAMMQLVEGGQVSLDDPVAKYLPAVPRAFGTAHNLGHLLTHRTALERDLFSVPAFTEQLAQLDTTMAYTALIDYASKGAAGSRFNYNNGGYVLLGAVIEAVTAKSYYDVIQERVFTPALMQQAGFVRRSALDKRNARGYRFANVENRVIRRRSNESALPRRGSAAGGAYCSATDLTRFARAVIDGTLVPKSVAALMQSPQVFTIPEPDGGRGGYGIGFEVLQSAQSVVRWGHRGGTVGASARLDVYPSADAVVVILANIDTAANIAAVALRDILPSA
jgi:D-alanyl-D-alanine carboxypeptidase